MLYKTTDGKNKRDSFEDLCDSVSKCKLCCRMEGSQRVLNYSSGYLDADVMFIGEAPGRLGADEFEIPFHGDKSGHNFEELLRFAGLYREDIFVTNSVLCNPKNVNGNNATPNKSEILNCSDNLIKQISIVDPRIVVPLGSIALESVRMICHHDLTLKNHVRTANPWYDRILIPLYHPGQRAMLHRSFANQRSDYQFVAECLNRLQSNRKRSSLSRSSIDLEVVSVVESILHKAGNISYFKLHKIFYLVEYFYVKKFKKRLTKAYIIRQKDGPYCTDLHIQRLKKSLPDLVVQSKNGQLLLSLPSQDIFSEYLDDSVELVVDDVVQKYAAYSNAEIKQAVYLTTPMRRLLKRESQDNVNVYNVPISL